VIVYVPVVALVAALWPAIPRSDRSAPIATLAAAAATLALCFIAVASAHGSGELLVIKHWIELDSFGALLLTLIALVYFTASLFSWGYLKSERRPQRARLYYANFNLFAFSMLCIPLLAEVGLVWIFVELTTLLSVLLVSYSLTSEAIEAAWKYMVLTLLGATIAVLGVLTLFWALHSGGSTDFTWSGLRDGASRMPPALLAVSFVLLLVGYGFKIGFVPLHTWLPDAHSQAPSPVCAMLSGVETSVVLYVLLRLRGVYATDAALHVGTWFAVFGLLSVVVAAVLIVRTHDYKRLFAFSTVEHMGIILAAASIFTPAGDVAALWQMLAHTVTKSFCFYAAGATLLVTGTREISAVRGLLGISRGAALALLFGGLAIGGAPPFAAFLSELAILRAGIAAHAYALVAILAAFLVLAFFGVLWHVTQMISGRPEAQRLHPRMPAACALAIVLAAVPVVVLGLWIPADLGRLLESAARILGA